MNENLIVNARNLTKCFGKFTAVDDVTFEVRKGEIFGFLGSNGAGKTTTIRMLTGLLKPTRGTGIVAGFDVDREYEKIKNRIGYMSQKFSLYNDLTVEENCVFFGGVYGLKKEKIMERITELDPLLGIKGKLTVMTFDLPPGLKQRIALCCSILHSPEIIFLDEPTGGVDPIARRFFWDLIAELSRLGTTVFVTTHYMDEAEYCHKISIMYQGKISAIDSPEGLKKRFGLKSIEEVFIHLTDK